MEEGGYYEYQDGMEHGIVSQIPNFSGRSQVANYDHRQTKAGPGFYTEQYDPEMGGHGPRGAALQENIQSDMGMVSASSSMTSQMSVHMAQMLMSHAASSSSVAQAVQAAATVHVEANLYDAQIRNFAMKSEKGLPLTPPGSPDDPKDVRGVPVPQDTHLSSVSPATRSAMQQHMLAKPVAMHRPSEKRIAQTRACLGSAMSSVTMQPESQYTDPSFPNTSPTLVRAMAAAQQIQKRPRSEKKPIPNDSKDEKYFERRKRNNNAAKKSRDARKAREDEIAIRASFLEKENAVLRVQVNALREEANKFRNMLMTKRSRP